MKNRFIAILSLLLALIMAFACFAGCGQESPENPADPPQTEQPDGDNNDGGDSDNGDNDNNGGDTNPSDEYVWTLPDAKENPADDDIFGTGAQTKPAYTDKDEFNGSTTLSTNKTMISSTSGVKSVLYDWEQTNKYNLNTALLPFWRSRNVYNETVTFKGIEDEAQLMYTPTRIVSVYDYYLEKEYKEGEDFVLEGNKIKLTSATKINYWTNYYLDYFEGISALQLSMVTASGKYVYASETEANKHQICVSYEHNDVWTGAVPVGQAEKIPNAINKLKNGQKINIGITGDSITYGRGSSGDFGYGSKTPRYATLVGDYLKAKFPASDITYENVGYGGKASNWGAESVSRFTTTPDICLIALGMNDLSTTAEQYKTNIQATVDALRAKNPNMEIVLISPMTGNKELVKSGTTDTYYGNMAEFEDKLVEIANEGTGIIVAPVSGITKSIYDNGKRFEDVNSNNLNHPNDYIHRVYAQTVLKVMLGDDFTALR